MKSIIFTMIWTILLVSLGLFVSFKAEDFSDKYVESLNKLEVYVKNEDWQTCDKLNNELQKNLKKDSKHWFKLLNHCHLGDIELSFNILSDGIYLKDIGTCLEEIENIKIYLHRMIESERYNLDHIL
ncbi:Uncharacterised protein [uncultured Clostridium sp.]|nr:Uncharacterised protein [uncultured Clostridium sp.]SCI86586.1 Uncharacterised protein [uncultured Clostridium sp.]